MGASKEGSAADKWKAGTGSRAYLVGNRQILHLLGTTLQGRPGTIGFVRALHLNQVEIIRFQPLAL